MPANIFLLFTGIAVCFYVGRIVGFQLGTHNLSVLIGLIMCGIWYFYLFKQKDKAKDARSLFLEFLVTAVIGGYVVVAFGLGS
jgi:hypothetical protein